MKDEGGPPHHLITSSHHHSDAAGEKRYIPCSSCRSTVFMQVGPIIALIGHSPIWYSDTQTVACRCKACGRVNRLTVEHPKTEPPLDNHAGHTVL